MVATAIDRAARTSCAATPLLGFLAGEFAAAVAVLWRPPHAEFFALPAARRHAAAILLAGLGRGFHEDADIRRRVEFARDADLAREVAGDASQGFMRMLAKAGEQLWTRADYATLMGLAAEPAAAMLLRHLGEVRPAAFTPIAHLPPALRTAPIVRVVASEAAARELAQAFALCVRMRMEADAARLAARWGAGGDARAVFQRAAQDLTPEEFRFPAPAPRLDAPFERIQRRQQLERLALEFRNCLADHAGRVAEGRMAVYVWRPDPSVAPPAAIALNWDVAGWRLAEAKAGDNEDLPEAALRHLVRVLAASGVRTGCSVQTMIRRIEEHASGETHFYRPPSDYLGQLELGDLWS
jgi:hypothetical protein